MSDSGPAQRPRLSVTSITLTTADADRAVRFWTQLLGWQTTANDPPVPDRPELGGWAQARPPAGVAGPTLNFEYEQHFVAPVWPSRPGRQFASEHLDIRVDDLAEASAWAVDHGAVLAQVQPQRDVRVFLDPDGHPFCLFT